MKTSKKKMAAGVAVAAAAVLTLAACGGSDSTTAPTAAPSATSSAAPSGDATAEPTDSVTTEPSATDEAFTDGEIAVEVPEGEEPITIADSEIEDQLASNVDPEVFNNAPTLTLKPGDVFELPYAEGFMDLVFSGEDVSKTGHATTFSEAGIIAPIFDGLPAGTEPIKFPGVKENGGYWRAEKPGTVRVYDSYKSPTTGEVIGSAFIITVK